MCICKYIYECVCAYVDVVAGAIVDRDDQHEEPVGHVPGEGAVIFGDMYEG